MCTPSECKDIVIRKFKFMAKIKLKNKFNLGRDGRKDPSYVCNPSSKIMCPWI